MSRSEYQPAPSEVKAIDAFADATYDLLHARAQSIGVLDVSLDVDGYFVECELMFSSGPDMGFSLDTRSGECRYCELLPDSKERWLEEVRGDLLVLHAPGRELLDAAALELLDGMLAARRPLLKRAAEHG